MYTTQIKFILYDTAESHGNQNPVKPIKNVLVYCHSKPINIPNDHWLYKDGTFDTFMDPQYDYKFETVDISGLLNYLPTYIADGFSDTFINEHILQYDLVFVPDCGGKWFEIQESTKDINYILSELCKLINSVLKLLKPNGTAIFSKVINKIIEESLPGYLKQHITNGYNVKKQTINMLNFIVINRK